MDEKRLKILEAAMGEFTEKGYQAASTNKICEKAGVSKGLIFTILVLKKSFILRRLVMRLILRPMRFVWKGNIGETLSKWRFGQRR